MVFNSLCVCVFGGFFFGLVLVPFLFWTALFASWGVGGCEFLSVCNVPAAKSTALWRFLTPKNVVS